MPPLLTGLPPPPPLLQRATTPSTKEGKMCGKATEVGSTMMMLITKRLVVVMTTKTSLMKEGQMLGKAIEAATTMVVPMSGRAIGAVETIPTPVATTTRTRKRTRRTAMGVTAMGSTRELLLTPWRQRPRWRATGLGRLGEGQRARHCDPFLQHRCCCCRCPRWRHPSFWQHPHRRLKTVLALLLLLLLLPKAQTQPRKGERRVRFFFGCQFLHCRRHR
mmetsp:Transcript_75390/g.147603  ORF Transcript_75390/g.147603 Transcript_75390/m.147603 type:complete len:219 (+) Transcript_75390:466-1122(+)